jgi:hypothetical protein
MYKEIAFPQEIAILIALPCLFEIDFRRPENPPSFPLLPVILPVVCILPCLVLPAWQESDSWSLVSFAISLVTLIKYALLSLDCSEKTKWLALFILTAILEAVFVPLGMLLSPLVRRETYKLSAIATCEMIGGDTYGLGAVAACKMIGGVVTGSYFRGLISLGALLLNVVAPLERRPDFLLVFMLGVMLLTWRTATRYEGEIRVTPQEQDFVLFFDVVCVGQLARLPVRTLGSAFWELPGSIRRALPLWDKRN